MNYLSISGTSSIKQKRRRRNTEMDSAATQRLISLAATFCLILIHTPPANSFNNTPSAYDVLEAYNFPIGLLPYGVRGYDFNDTTGQFSAYFSHSCSFSGGFYQLKYEPTIKGYLSNGMLSSLEGVSVKMFFLWIDISEIIRNGDGLDFYVWILSTRFPVDYFEEPPQCGCGINCSPRQVRKLRAN